MRPNHNQEQLCELGGAFQLRAPMSDLGEAIQLALDSKVKPPGSRGRLEALAFQLAQVQQTLQPTAGRCQLLLFAADHGIAAHGVPAYPPLLS